MIEAHVTLLALIVLWTVGCIAFRPGIAKRSIWPVLLAFLPFWLIGITCMLLLMQGVPTVEWLVPSICVLLIGLLCRSETLWTFSRWALLGVSILLLVDFAVLTGSNRYTANPAGTGNIREAAERTRFRAALKRKHSPDAVLPAGPLGETTVWESEKEWHTPLTRLYRVRSEKAVVWYSGGPLSEGKVEVR